MMLCTCYAGGYLYRWYYVHVVHMVLVYIWYYVNVIHVVLCTRSIIYVHGVVMVS